MNRYICLHGHFYQPPRENAWLEEVEQQDSAYPYHDWNYRITSECYAPNAASRLLDAERRIIDIVNNYSKISFNFGPTLLSWMERHEQEVYEAILEADKQSREHFNGHGSAFAQVYNHMIMPLANSRDKRTQVIWGLRDFEKRFKRKAEGMWLSETAVDTETLELLVEFGIKFTVLAPRQAHRVRKIGEEEWQEVNDQVDPKRAYRCNLPSGKSIALFFYDGPISQDIAFGDLLSDGGRFADRLTDAFADDNDEPQLVHVATDGETYGHHHRFGDMALAYCLYNIEANEETEITIYGDYLERFPPEYEVEIHENSSWSCVHGVERWRSACGCAMRSDWQQNWRAPLRGAMDWLRDSLRLIYEEHGGELLTDPWAARDDYIEVILDRSDESLQSFFDTYSRNGSEPEQLTKRLKLLEMQRYTMLMYTSCGWFFDEISGIETMQVIFYAARAMQLAREAVGIDLEPAFIQILDRAPSNIPKLKTGAGAYREHVQPSVLDLERVGAHYAVQSLFDQSHNGDSTRLYSYEASSLVHDRYETGRQVLVVGRARLRSLITREEGSVAYAVLHLGEQNLIGSIQPELEAERLDDLREKISKAFHDGNIADVVSLMDKVMEGHSYSLWHLFKDDQRRILDQIMTAALEEIERSFRSAYERSLPLMKASDQMQLRLPSALSATVSFVINTDLRLALEQEEPEPVRLHHLVDEAERWEIDVDRTTLGFVAGHRCNELMEAFQDDPDDITLLTALDGILATMQRLSVTLDVWPVQNMYFLIGKKLYSERRKQAESGDADAQRWVEHFERLSEFLQVKLT